jgi:hypothetical protein
MPCWAPQRYCYNLDMDLKQDKIGLGRTDCIELLDHKQSFYYFTDS